MSVTRIAAAVDPAELEAARREASDARHHLREVEERVEQLRRRVAAGPSSALAEATARGDKAEEQILALEQRGRRLAVAQQHGLAPELLQGVADDDLEGFASRLSEHVAGERERLAHEHAFEQATTHRRDSMLMNGVAQPPDDMNEFIRKGFRP